MSALKSPVGRILARSRPVAGAIILFSGVVNVLALTGSFYMLQVYDRVLASRSVSTLIAISLLALGLYALNAFLEVVRARVMTRVGMRLESDLLQPVHDLILRLPLAGRSAADATQPLRDMEALRLALSGQAPIAFIDLPWMPFYLAFVFMLHPVLGWTAMAGMGVLVGLTLLTEQRMRAPARASAGAAAKRFVVAEAARRNAEVIRAMGFGNRAAQRFYAASKDVQDSTGEAADISGTLGAISKILRMVLQSLVLGLGAYLVLQNQMSSGAIIAASIVVGRAIAPVELAIANWRLFTGAWQARERLDALIRHVEQQQDVMPLPLPKNELQVDGLTIAPPGQRQPVLRNARLTLKAGDALAILGPSGAGKSSLVRGLVGAWHALGGAVRLDGAPIEQYPVEAIGRIIGYLPQDVDLFDGTVAENIARLDPEASEEAIVAAAREAGVHDLILRLPNGYNTMLGEGGSTLSVGQRQRIGLARAMYGAPFLIVLDEPNAHLDQDGEAALALAVAAIRARGGIAIIVAHRSAILAQCNLVAWVADGEVKGFGPRDEMLQKIRPSKPTQPVQPPPPPQTGSGFSRPSPAPILQTGTQLRGRLNPGKPDPKKTGPDEGGAS